MHASVLINFFAMIIFNDLNKQRSHTQMQALFIYTQTHTYTFILTHAHGTCKPTCICKVAHASARDT